MTKKKLLLNTEDLFHRINIDIIKIFFINKVYISLTHDWAVDDRGIKFHVTIAMELLTLAFYLSPSLS